MIIVIVILRIPKPFKRSQALALPAPTPEHWDPWPKHVYVHQRHWSQDTILCYTILYYTILYHAILYCTILYYTILYYTGLISYGTGGGGVHRGSRSGPRTFALSRLRNLLSCQLSIARLQKKSASAALPLPSASTSTNDIITITITITMIFAITRPPPSASHRAWPRSTGSRGNHLSNTACLKQVFPNSCEECSKLWWSLTLWTTHTTNKACTRQVALDKSCHPTLPTNPPPSASRRAWPRSTRSWGPARTTRINTWHNWIILIWFMIWLKTCSWLSDSTPNALATCNPTGISVPCLPCAHSSCATQVLHVITRVMAEVGTGGPCRPWRWARFARLERLWGIMQSITPRRRGVTALPTHPCG